MARQGCANGAKPCLSSRTGYPLQLTSEVHVRWRSVADARMPTFFIVKLKIGLQMLPSIPMINIFVEIYFLVFHGAPEPFDHDIVKAPALPAIRLLLPNGSCILSPSGIYRQVVMRLFAPIRSVFDSM